MANNCRENSMFKKDVCIEEKDKKSSFSKTKLVIEDTTIYEVDLECESCKVQMKQ